MNAENAKEYRENILVGCANIDDAHLMRLRSQAIDILRQNPNDGWARVEWLVMSEIAEYRWLLVGEGNDNA